MSKLVQIHSTIQMRLIGVFLVFTKALFYVELGLDLLRFFDGICERFFGSHQTHLVHIVFICEHMKFLVSVAVRV